MPTWKKHQRYLVYIVWNQFMLVTFICLPSRECDNLELSEAPRSSMKYRFWHQLLTLFEKERVEEEGKCLLGWALLSGPGNSWAVGASSTESGGEFGSLGRLVSSLATLEAQFHPLSLYFLDSGRTVLNMMTTGREPFHPFNFSVTLWLTW